MIESLKSEITNLEGELALRARRRIDPSVVRQGWTAYQLQERIAFLRRRLQVEDYLQYRRRREMLARENAPEVAETSFTM